MGGVGHDHSEVVDDRLTLAVVFSITAAILVVEVIGGLLTGSLALLADAGHMLTDAGGLALAFTAAHLATKPATGKRTWGFARAEVLAAGAQAILLLGVGVFIFVEGIRRLIDPPPVASTPMVIFGVIGLLGNGLSIVLLLRHRGRNLNLRAAFLEVINDALGSVAVLVAAVIIALTGWLRADAIVSLLIGALILPRTLLLLRDALRVLLESTPRGLDLAAVRRHVLEVPHVRGLHDLHASQISSGLPVLSAHVVVDDACFYDGHLTTMLDQLQRCVAEHFEVSVEHSTFQFESAAHQSHEHLIHH